MKAEVELMLCYPDGDWDHRSIIVELDRDLGTYSLGEIYELASREYYALFPTSNVIGLGIGYYREA